MAAADNVTIQDDYDLLKLMLSDSDAQSGLYHPGPYWLRKSKIAAVQIKRHGLSRFRGASSLIGLSFTDSLYHDVRLSLVGGARGVLGWAFRTIPP